MKTYLLISFFLLGLFSQALSKPNINEESQEPDELNRECPTIHGITTNLLFKVFIGYISPICKQKWERENRVLGAFL